MSSITVIITVWKRTYLEEQLEALSKQSILPENIWIIQNEKHICIDEVVKKYTPSFPSIAVFRSDVNLKFHGRFSLAVHVQTEYVLIIDDDVIPSVKWLEICIEKCNKYSSVISCTGRIITPGNYRPEGIGMDLFPVYFIGDNYNRDDNNFCQNDTFVDYGCNSYFLRTEWVRLFWKIWPCTFQTGDDIHLSATLKILQSIPTIVPKQTTFEEFGNLKKYYSQDMISSWRSNDFIDTREEVFKYLINVNEWKPILWN